MYIPLFMTVNSTTTNRIMQKGLRSGPIAKRGASMVRSSLTEGITRGQVAILRLGLGRNVKRQFLCHALRLGYIFLLRGRSSFSEGQRQLDVLRRMYARHGGFMVTPRLDKAYCVSPPYGRRRTPYTSIIEVAKPSLMVTAIFS